MHKKDAKKRKKLINQIRHHRVTHDGRVLTADGRETLLGNLAPVKHIPMLPWKRVMILPTIEKKIVVSTTGKTAWMYRMFEDISKKGRDLIGFTPVKELDSRGYDDVGIGSVGIAAQVKRIEPQEKETAIVYLKGVCRYENQGFLPSEENNFCINVKWFEDNREADALVRPQYEQCLKIIERVSKALGDRMSDYSNVSETVKYNYEAAQYMSFMLIEGFSSWFTPAEHLEILQMRSTSERLKLISERSDKNLPALEHRMKRMTERSA
jgi:ATP-dependent Lon protease